MLDAGAHARREVFEAKHIEPQIAELTPQRCRTPLRTRLLRSEPYKTAASARTPARGSNQYAAHHVAQGCQVAPRHLYRPCLWL